MKAAALLAAGIFVALLEFPSGLTAPCGCSCKKELPARKCGEDDCTFYKRIFPVASCSCENTLKQFYEKVFYEYKGESKQSYVTRIDIIFNNVYHNLDCRFDEKRTAYLQKYYEYKYCKQQGESDEKFFERVLTKTNESECVYKIKVKLIKKYITTVDWSKVKIEEKTSKGFSFINKAKSVAKSVGNCGCKNEKKKEKQQPKRVEAPKKKKEAKPQKPCGCVNKEKTQKQKEQQKENVKKINQQNEERRKNEEKIKKDKEQHCANVKQAEEQKKENKKNEERIAEQKRKHDRNVKKGKEQKAEHCENVKKAEEQKKEHDTNAKKKAEQKKEHDRNVKKAEKQEADHCKNVKKAEEQKKEHGKNVEKIAEQKKEHDKNVKKAEEQEAEHCKNVKKAEEQRKEHGKNVEKIAEQKKEHDKNVKKAEAQEAEHSKNVNIIKAKNNEHEENVIKWTKANYRRKSSEDITTYYKRICIKTENTNEEYIKRITFIRSLYNDLDLWYNENYLCETKEYYYQLYSQKQETQEEYFKRLTKIESYETEENYAKRLNILHILFPTLAVWYEDKYYATYTKTFYKFYYKKQESETNEIYLNRVFKKIEGESEECFWKRVKLIQKTFPDYKCWYEKENLKKLDACKDVSGANNEDELKTQVESETQTTESDKCRQAKLECLQSFFKSSKSSKTSESTSEEEEVSYSSKNC